MSQEERVGLFDTLTLEPPVVCPRCGKSHRETQTKLFNSTLDTWKPGWFVQGSPIVTGVLRESVSCCRIGETSEWTTIPIFVVIWHGIYSGHEMFEEGALQRLASFDRLDLLKWLEEAQDEVREWKSRYRHLKSDVHEWVEEQKRPRSERSPGEQAFGAFRALPPEVLESTNPLAKILELNSEDHPAPRGFFEN